MKYLPHLCQLINERRPMLIILTADHSAILHAETEACELLPTYWSRGPLLSTTILGVPVAVKAGGRHSYLWYEDGTSTAGAEIEIQVLPF